MFNYAGHKAKSSMIGKYENFAVTFITGMIRVSKRLI